MHPGKAGQPLRPARSGQKPQFHFRQPQFCGCCGNTEMTAQRNFQASTQCRPVNCGDDRLGRIFDELTDIRQIRLQGGLAKLPDVGTCNKSASLAQDDHGRNIVVRNAFFQACPDSCANGLGQGVYRRVVNGDDPDVSFF